MPISPDQILKTIMHERQKLHGYAWIVVGDPEEAEDVVQEACLQAMKHAEQINDQQHLKHWLRESIRLRGMAARRMRLKRASQLSLEVLALLAEVKLDETNEDYNRRMAALRHCIDLLGDRSRDTLALRYGKGMKPAEIAEKTNRPIQSIYKMITRTHSTLRACIIKRLAGRGDA